MNTVSGIGPGALVEVPDGMLPVSWLETGTPVRCRDAGVQPVAGIARLTYAGRDLLEYPEASPVRIRAAALGAGLPINDMVVAPGQRLIRPAPYSPWHEPEAVPAARAGLPAPEGQAEYWLIALPVPDMILVEGLWMRAAPLSALHAMQGRAA